MYLIEYFVFSDFSSGILIYSITRVIMTEIFSKKGHFNLYDNLRGFFDFIFKKSQIYWILVHE